MHRLKKADGKPIKNDREQREKQKIQFASDNLVSVIGGVNYGEHIYIYGTNHKQASTWLSENLRDTTKGQEILKRLECEKTYNVLISNERA